MSNTILNEKTKRILFNGRTLAGDFRRGWWKKADAIKLKSCPDAFKADDLVAGLWYNGCLAIKATSDAVIVNINTQSDDIKQIADYIAQLNNKPIKTADLGKAMRSSGNRDAELMI